VHGVTGKGEGPGVLYNSFTIDILGLPGCFSRQREQFQVCVKLAFKRNGSV
jgi:hypothetical protein